MRIELPRSFERLGNILIYATQKVYALDAGSETISSLNDKYFVVKKVFNEQSWSIEQEMVIIIPVKNERLKVLEGVICGIPHNCLIIIVSNSSREGVDRFAMEKNMIENICHFSKRDFLVLHQRDPDTAALFHSIGYTEILDEDGLIKNGKAEGMQTGILLANLLNKKYLGFIDADNYFPGSVYEYVKIYAAAFSLAKSQYAMGRILWHSKPKPVNSAIFFSKWGRVSRITNYYLNRLISVYTGFETDIINTANAGEHCMTTDLALQMDVGSDFTIEPYNFINLFEKSGGITASPLNKDVFTQPVEIYQIESRNPHLHESKGNEHVKDMIDNSLGCIYNSPLCPEELKNEILKELKKERIITGNQLPTKRTIYKALKHYNLEKANDVFDPDKIGVIMNIN